MFEKAARLKLRFNTPIGELSTEDLWELPLTGRPGKANLDDLARALHQQIEQAPTVSFVTKTQPVSAIPQLKFDIVLHIINTKLSEQETAQKAKDTRERKQKIMALIEQKQDEKLAGASIEELQALVDAL
jgi:hypothetical protein